MQDNREPFKKRVLAPPATPTHTTTPPDLVTEAKSEYVILADERSLKGIAYHFWNAFNQLLVDPWFGVLKQYGVESARYAGYQFVEFPDNADEWQLYDVAKQAFASNRLVLCLTTPNVKGFLTDGWAAYHTWDSDNNTWSIVPCGDWPGWERYGGSPFGHPHTELIAGTHEWAEYLTDPTGQGFTAKAGDFSTEVGDECNWDTHKIQAGNWQYLVTKVWDDANKTCAP